MVGLGVDLAMVGHHLAQVSNDAIAEVCWLENHDVVTKRTQFAGKNVDIGVVNSQLPLTDLGSEALR